MTPSHVVAVAVVVGRDDATAVGVSHRACAVAPASHRDVVPAETRNPATIRRRPTNTAASQRTTPPAPRPETTNRRPEMATGGAGALLSVDEVAAWMQRRGRMMIKLTMLMMITVDSDVDRRLSQLDLNFVLGHC